MQSLLRLLRTRFVRFGGRKRPAPPSAAPCPAQGEPSVPGQKPASGTTILSYDSFR